MTELILNHQGTSYRTELCKIESVELDPYRFRVRVCGVDNSFTMLFAIIDLEDGHGVMKAFNKAMVENFNVYSIDEIKGKIALLVKDMSGKIVGITSSAQNFSKEPVFREALGV